MVYLDKEFIGNACVIFFQNDLLSPAAAKGYIPGMIEAAQLASKGAPSIADNMNYFLNCCAVPRCFPTRDGYFFGVRAGRNNRDALHNTEMSS